MTPPAVVLARLRLLRQLREARADAERERRDELDARDRAELEAWRERSEEQR